MAFLELVTKTDVTRVKNQEFSLITNECILEEDADEMANHKEDIATANQGQDQLFNLILLR